MSIHGPLPLESRHSLPLQLASFVGRACEIAAVTELLAGTPLLTLIGTWGVYKARLALQMAESLVEAYPQGVWLVELAPLAGAIRVPGIMRAALAVPEQSGRPPLDPLQDALRTCVYGYSACGGRATGCSHTRDALIARILASDKED